ncbi:hypothetical protein, partial [Aneurinibacillus aneurinilyticus]|uniref:hypothetical protein n=1 Tax=Aneurinibacillus aneurinilyticus TaxID=1391 RepID=UPI003526237B
SETGLSSSGSILNEMNTQIFDKHQQFLEEQKRKEELARQQLANLSYQTSNTTVPSPKTKNLTFDDYKKGLDLDEKRRKYADGWLAYLTSPARYLMNETLGGKAVQRTSEKAGDAAFFINRRPEDYTDTGSSLLNKGADIAGFGVGTVSNPSSTGVNSVTRSLASLTKDAASFAKGTADEIAGGILLRNPNNVLKMQEPVQGTTERLLSNLATRHSKQLAKPTNMDILKGAGIATAGSFGMDALKGAQNPNVPLEDRSFASKVGASTRAGTGDTLKSLGEAANYLGFEDTSKSLKKAGENVTKGFDLQYGKEFSASSLLDPNWYATTVTRSIPTTAGLLAVGLAGGEAAGAVAGLTKLGPFGRTLVKGISGALLGRSIESSMEAGSTLEQALERGMSKEEAKKAANSTFGKNMAL